MDTPTRRHHSGIEMNSGLSVMSYLQADRETRTGRVPLGCEPGLGFVCLCRQVTESSPWQDPKIWGTEMVHDDFGRPAGLATWVMPGGEECITLGRLAGLTGSLLSRVLCPYPARVSFPGNDTLLDARDQAFVVDERRCEKFQERTSRDRGAEHQIRTTTHRPPDVTCGKS